MAEAQWIKITTDIFDNEKLLLIESMIENKAEVDSIFMIWIKLLVFAGKQNNSGVFMMGKIPYTEKMLATIFHREEALVHKALQFFEDFGMIERIDGVIVITNWGKHQSLDQLEARNEYMKKYMKQYREKQKNITSGNSEINSKVNSKVNVNCAEKIRGKKKKKKNKEEGEGDVDVTTAPPTLAEISAYIHNNNLSVNPSRFFSYYNEREWLTTKGNPIDWEAKLLEWDHDDKQKAKATSNPEMQTSSNPFLALAKKENLL